MASLEEEILTEFYARLGDSEGITPAMLKALKDLLASEAKPKPEDFVQIFSPPSEDSIP